MDINTERELKQLEAYVDELIVVCERLRKENRTLRREQQAHIAERANLIEKHENASAKIEEMIERLKSLEDMHE